MSCVTTEPAPTTTSSQIVTGRIVAFDPMETREPMRVASRARADPWRARRSGKDR